MSDDIFETPSHLGDDNKDYSVQKSKTDEWEELLVDTGVSEPKTIGSLFDYRRLKWLYIVLMVAIAIIGIRLVSLQIFASDYYQEVAEENRFRLHVLRAPRGVIYDRNKNLLVKNIPSFDVMITPADLPKNEEERSKYWENLFPLLDVSEEKYQKIKENIDYLSFNPVLVRENIDRDRALVLETKSQEIPGLTVEKNPNREYQDAEFFAHVLGYTGKITEEELTEEDFNDYLINDKIGRGGLEQYYEGDLRGEYGKKQVEVDSLGKIMKVMATKEPEPGSDVILSIDKDLQEKTTQVLEQGATNAGVNEAAAVVLDPNTGEILTLVSIPKFDNNTFSKGISEDEYLGLIEDPSKPLFNRVISGSYPPGSTVKPVIGLAALEEGVVTPYTTIEDKGSIDVPNKYNPDIIYHFVGWERSGLGVMDIYSAIAMSSDIYFYIISGGFEDREGLGSARLVKYYKKFGVGSELGVDLPAENPGLVPTPEWKMETKGEEWYLGDDYNIGIGQGDVLATPLQVANFTAAVANGGKLMKPFIVKKIINNNEDFVKSLEPKVIRENLGSRENINTIQQAMRQTVEDGTAKGLASLPFAVAGKTGTSQYGDLSKTHAWFTCYAPYEDPEIVVTVLVEGGGEGSKTAAPIASEILQWYNDNKK